MSDRGHTGSHTGRNVAIVGGAMLVAWLVLRGRGRGASGNGPEVAPASSRCLVWIRLKGIYLDGVLSDVATVVARCRAAGAAEVRATGGADVTDIESVIKGLRVAGVTLHLAPDLHDFASRLS